MLTVLSINVNRRSYAAATGSMLFMLDNTMVLVLSIVEVAV